MDKFILDEKNYKKKIKLKLEKEERKDLIYIPKKYKRDNLQFTDKEIKMKKYQNDIFNFREKGDNLLNNWIIKQKDPIIIFLSEFISGTKI